MTNQHEEPWWSSGTGAGIGDEDPFDAHRNAREGRSGTHGDPLTELLRWLRDGRHRLDSETCGVCPLCTLIASLDESRPELAHHLSEAARHLTLAAKSFVDAQAAAYGRQDLEHIEVEDDEHS